jgi:hypothetical protein
MNKRNTKLTVKSGIAASIMALSCLMSVSAMADSDKALVIRQTAPTPTVAPAVVQSQLSVTFKASKEVYQVGEAMSFLVKGNQEFYLWLFAINEDQKRARMLVPSFLQKGNKYKGGTTYSLPAKSKYELFADKSGVEKIVMVASTNWINNFDKKLFSKSEQYLSTSPENLNMYMKGLRVRPSTPQPQNDKIIVQELSVLVSGAATVASTPPPVVMSAPVTHAATTQPMMTDDAVVFVSQNSSNYKLGDLVSVAYGANKPGYVSVYVQYPNGKVESLFQKQVDGKTIYNFEAEAVPPVGNQYLMAVYSPEKKSTFEVEQVPLFAEHVYQGKGLRLVPEKRPSYDMSRFVIK